MRIANPLCEVSFTYLTNDDYIAGINEEDVPEKHRWILRLLHRIIEEPEVQGTMDAEDDFLEELQELERSSARKDQTIAEQSQTIAEQGKVLAEKEQALAEKERALTEQQKLVEDLRRQLRQDAS